MEVVTKIAPIALALIMLGLGLGLTGRDFLRVINNPKDFIIGFVSQLILLPIVAFIIANRLNLLFILKPLPFMILFRGLLQK